MVETFLFSSGPLSGIPAAPGMAEGQAIILGSLDVRVPRSNGHDPSVELQRLQNARAKARTELLDLKRKVSLAVQSGEADIFDAHMMFLDDVALLKKVEKTLESTLNAEACWLDAVESFAVQLEALPDPTLKARAVDIRDVGRRVLCHLLGIPVDEPHLENPAVVIASDLTPSQTAGLDKGKVLAFCMEKGGPTSHTAILAKALGIPAVVGLGSRILTVKPGSNVLVDGACGQVFINPDDQTANTFRQSADQSKQQKLEALDAASQPAVTLDGFQAEIAANIGGLKDADAALANHADGVGLFRTEFLFLNRLDLPGEAEQVKTYKQVFDRLGDLPIVVRTLDIGGDKAVSYIGFEEEANPFLGWRAIRMNEGRPDVFSSQVRALLQAGTGKDLRIMIPMVSNIEEIILARQLLENAREQLQNEGIPCSDQVQFGIMVEIPSAAMIADRLAPYLDFFSIGTNDLTQYTLAVDRTNARVAHLASPYHPAVLRLIQMTIEAAHDHDKWVGVCGEMAGEVIATPLLLGLGLDEFGMAPTMVPSIKQAVRKCALSDCQMIAEEALTLTSISEVIGLLTSEASRLDLL